jgi:hypothetical protein
MAEARHWGRDLTGSPLPIDSIARLAAFAGSLARDSDEQQPQLDAPTYLNRLAAAVETADEPTTWQEVAALLSDCLAGRNDAT